MSSEDFEHILAREAQLMYEKAKGFNPFRGDLTVWRGEIAGRGEYRGLKFEVEVKIPSTFPFDPPSVRMISPTDHPNVDPETGYVHLNILDQWKPEYHVYHVINTLKGTFARIPPRPLFKKPAKKVTITLSGDQVPPPSPEVLEKVTLLEKRVEELQEKLREKEEEIASLKSKLARAKPELLSDIETTVKLEVDERLELESERIAIEDLLRSLEEKFENGEIDPTEYTQLYKNYKKEWYIITKKLQMLKGSLA